MTISREKTADGPPSLADGSTPRRPSGTQVRRSRRKRSRMRGSTLLSIGVALLIFTVAWSFIIVPGLFDAAAGDGGGSGGSDLGGPGGEDDGFGLDEGTAILEGRIGFMGLLDIILLGEGSDTDLDFLNITREDFDLVWRDFEITENGLVEPSTGQPLFGDDAGGSGGEAAPALQGFDDPIGPEARDYQVMNAIVNGTVTARYMGETSLEGRTVRTYRVDLRDASIDMQDLSFAGLPGSDGLGDTSGDGDGAMDGGAAGDFFSEDTELLYDETSTYYIDVETAIPLDLETDLEVSMVFPDSSLMLVTEGEEVTTTHGEIWVPHPTIPGAYESIDVTIETHLVTRLAETDDTIAVFESWVVYYDNATGEPLPDQNQPEREIYAVDRGTSRYLPGYGNSERRGYHGFPIGSAERRAYPLWDAMANDIFDADFVAEDVIGGRQVFIYDQVAEDVVVEGPNMVLPVYRHPGLVYMYDSNTRYTIDAATSLLLDLEVEATVLLASPGPVLGVSLPVTSFSFSFDDDFTEMMLGIADLYENVLLPMSNEEVPVFAMSLSFTPEMTGLLVEVATFVETLDDTFNLWIPIALVSVGASLVILGLYRARRSKADPEEMPRSGAKRDIGTPSDRVVR